MKKFLLIAAAALSLTACSNETTEELSSNLDSYSTRSIVEKKEDASGDSSKGYFACKTASRTCHLNETKTVAGFEEKCALHDVDPETTVHLHCLYCHNWGLLNSDANNTYGGLIFNVFDPEKPLSQEFITNVIDVKTAQYGDPYQNKGERIFYDKKDDLENGLRPEAEFEGNLYWHYYYCHPDALREMAPTHNGGNGFGI